MTFLSKSSHADVLFLCGLRALQWISDKERWMWSAVFRTDKMCECCISHISHTFLLSKQLLVINLGLLWLFRTWKFSLTSCLSADIHFPPTIVLNLEDFMFNFLVRGTQMDTLEVSSVSCPQLIPWLRFGRRPGSSHGAAVLFPRPTGCII